MRPGHQFLEAFQADEPDVAVERELDLVRVQDVEDVDLVAAEAQVPQAARAVGSTSSKQSEIRNTSPRRLIWSATSSSSGPIDVLSRGCVSSSVCRIVLTCPIWLARRQLGAPPGVEDAQADAVALVDDQVRQRRGQQLGVFELVGRRPSP